MKKIKWYNVFYLIFNIYAIIITLKALKHVNNLEGYNNQRLTFLIVFLYGTMFMGSILLRKQMKDRKENK